jgi:hypothetical protein
MYATLNGTIDGGYKWTKQIGTPTVLAWAAIAAAVETTSCWSYGGNGFGHGSRSVAGFLQGANDRGLQGSTDHSETSAYLKSNLDLTSVAAHYGEQLKGAGWQEQESGVDGPMAWRTYAFQDEDGEDWSALFYALALPKKEGLYYLFVQANIAGLEDLYPGGFLFARSVPIS